MKDNIDRLLEAIDQPDRFSDEELDKLLRDSELRQLYSLMSKTSDALTDEPIADVDGEWERLAAAYAKQNKRVILPFFRRHAAAVLIPLVASLAVVAATIGISHSINHSKPSKSDQKSALTTDLSDDVLVENDTTIVDDTVLADEIIFKDKSLELIIADISEYYGASFNFDNGEVKHLRLYYKWDRSQSLSQVVDQLNSFEQIRIRVNGNILTVE